MDLLIFFLENKITSSYPDSIKNNKKYFYKQYRHLHILFLFSNRLNVSIKILTLLNGCMNN